MHLLPKAFAGINSLLHRHPADFTVKYVYRFWFIHPHTDEVKNPGSLAFHIQITLYMVILSSNHFLLVLRSFEPRAPLIKPNAPVACIFFRSSYFPHVSREINRRMHANLALSIRISEIHKYMPYRNEHHRSSKNLTTLCLSLQQYVSHLKLICP